ncbi:L-aminoadipate-semialdehyde dehydrogenase [Fusarium oxysporum f. sp. vasinfectum 25433]|uniref:L-aminoadipate-semialdehyde dehydrogenase n=1 Tax=Fusarium oxysporum f. sp. vasinfectum 25433 TaxID=1089449 RepID=X0ME55_FUSOX|nr:L-aminoadipate-semialdehyde dehydrogenase [Fusarium oxysporum f. sp. vasinfectum 25433]
MIFAHRSAELVCAYMGTLAAGAIVTVLDPQYPPQRQQIYLQVSKPTALISIRKATEESGPLAPLVQKCIDNELSIKIKIPDLRFTDDGELTAGEDRADIFANVKERASTPPDMLIGPDSNCTLSFTSGTQGLPKGVLGRHYSLAKYFPWMAERFGLSSESVFACLSGISHDPIQRDIMTPLALGASLILPTKEDIQHVRLSEWMRKWSPTTTHLTPAMGQILVGGATAQFPSLRQVFFFGDVLTTRDCRSLQTSRAVSYFEVPSAQEDPTALDSLGDSIPAGWGMKGVQVLVVDREDHTKISPIGVVGEIYIRAAGLAEKWVEADKANDKGEPWRKYYKGPRDRLYVTGDLGEYRPDGAVRVLGRMDSQVKGLQDINEEGVEIGPCTVYLKRFRRIQAEVRDHLKSRLPAHSVPSIYIVLQKLPLNPNGKVDSPNLPFPDASLMTEDASEEDLKSWETFSETEKTIATQWSTLIPGLNAKMVRPDSSFFDCGGHSLLAQQLLLNLRKELRVDVTISVLYANPTLRGLGSAVDSLRSGQAVTVDRSNDTVYSDSLDELTNTLDANGATFFLTGATGFLGAYLAKDILDRKNTKLIACIRGAKDLKFAKERLAATGRGAVLEYDDLLPNRTGLGTGYGQTKWVSEQLVREAGRRGLRGAIVRPGYILGSRNSGVSNTGDWIVRLLKGCCQLSARPRIINSINAIPVNHVACVVVASTLNPLPGMNVVHVTAHPRLRMNKLLSALSYYGYKVPKVNYDI